MGRQTDGWTDRQILSVPYPYVTLQHLGLSSGGGGVRTPTIKKPYLCAL